MMEVFKLTTPLPKIHAEEEVVILKNWDEV